MTERSDLNLDDLSMMASDHRSSFPASTVRRLIARIRELDGINSELLKCATSIDDRPDAERYRKFCDAGWPVCFLGDTYSDKASLDTAIDAAPRSNTGETA